ncbi:MAG TPA: hypothetical protein VI893_01230, partial [Thermoplasmata archaeon]|nr:hypothetical protein [Thermoplasmata archaeon]
APAEANVELPRDARVRRGSVKLRAELSPLRVLAHRGGSWRSSRPTLPGTSGSIAVVLSPHHWIAQGFKSEEAATLRRVEFLARVKGVAGLVAELRSGGSEPGREIMTREELEAGDLPEGERWLGLDLEEPLDPRKNYWLVLRCTEGEITLTGERGDSPLLCYSKDGGSRWASYDFDLRHRVLSEAPRDGGGELSVGQTVAWAGERDADLVETLADALESQVRSAPGTAKRVKVPLRFSTARVGMVELYDLDVEYETGEEAEEGMEKVRTITDMIEELRSEVSDLGDRLGPRAKELKIVPGGREEKED